MTTRLIRSIAAIALAGGLAGSSGPLLAQAEKKAATPGVAGKWTMLVKSPHGEITMGLVLEQEGKKVTGTLSSDHTGDLRVEGEFADAVLTLATTGGNASSKITLDGRLTGDVTLAGYLSTASADMTWTAERLKSAR